MADNAIELLVDHLHERAERERVLTGRDLHDTLGALLLAAIMDVGWLSQHTDLSVEARSRLSRIQETLRTGIEFKRRIVERLRSSLLADVGPLAALSWLVRSTCSSAAVDHISSIEVDNLQLSESVSTELYRMVQEGLELLLEAQSRSPFHFTVSSNGCQLTLFLSRIPPIDTPRVRVDSPLYLSIGHRTRRLRGRVVWASDGTIRIDVPLAGL